MAAATTPNARQQPGQGQAGAGAGAGAGGGAGAGPASKGRAPWKGPHPFGSSNNANNSASPARMQQHNMNSGSGAAGGSGATGAGASGQATPSASTSSSGSTYIAVTNEMHAKMHDRMLFLLVNMIGKKVQVSLKNGPVYTGILSSTSESEQLSVCLKAARALSSPSSSTQSATDSKAVRTLVLQGKDVVDILVDNMDFDTAPSSSASRLTSPSSAANNGVFANGMSNAAGASIMAAMQGGRAGPGRDAFRTDTDISGITGQRDQRELQRWGSSSAARAADGGIGGSSLEDDGEALEGPSAATSRQSTAPQQGGATASGKWDQFATNERLFGARTNYQEEMYTTTLDRSAPGFKEREAEAARLAREIMSGDASNAHVAEERGITRADDSGLDEEDKYSGVLRGANAYVPPGARRGLPNQGAPPAKAGPTSTNARQEPAINGTTESVKQQEVATTRQENAVPDVSVTTAQGKEALPTPTGPGVGVVDDFKRFVGTEKERMLQKKQQIQKQQKDEKFADLVRFSKSFTLKSKVPEDLVPLLAKDEAKQRDIATRQPSADKAASLLTPSASSTASTIKPSASTTVSPSARPSGLPSSSAVSATPSQQQQQQPKKTSPYALSPIPPFDPVRAAAARAAKDAAKTGASATTADSKPALTSKFNAAAPAFVFRPGAAAFTPGGAGVAAAPVAASPAAKAGFIPATQQSEQASAAPIPAPAPAPVAATAAIPAPADALPPAPAPVQPVNPFFGTAVPRPTRADRPIHVKEDFSPFRNVTHIPMSNEVTEDWGFMGRPFRQIVFPQGSPEASTSASTNPSTGMSTPAFGGNGSAIAHAISPKPAAGLPVHFYPQQQQHANGGRPPHNPSASAHAAGRNNNVRSPQASQQQHPHHHMARTPSNVGGPPLVGIATSRQGNDEAASTKSSGPTPVPSSNTSQVGAPSQGMPQGQGQPHVVPYALYQGHPFAGAHMQGNLGQAGQYRFSPAGMPPQQGGTGQLGQGGQIHHIALQPGAHMPYPGPQGFVTQMPFSPQAMHGNQSMFSPQLGAQMSPGQYMQPMYVQSGPRGQGPQMPNGPGQHVFYQHVQAQPNMQQQFMAVPPQGMPMPTPQPMYEQSNQ